MANGRSFFDLRFARRKVASLPDSDSLSARKIPAPAPVVRRKPEGARAGAGEGGETRDEARDQGPGARGARSEERGGSAERRRQEQAGDGDGG